MSNIESTKGEIVMYQPDETLHVNNIFKEDELTESSVVKESLTTAKDGKRYKTKMYNLETFRLHPYARDLSPRTTEEHQINPYPVVMTARFFCFFHSITI